MADSKEVPETPIVGDLNFEEKIDREANRQRTGDILKRQTRGGRYILRRELARGGMGVIHNVMDQDLGRISAMKVIAASMIDDDRKLAAFVKEARITALLEHPNIIPVHEIGMIDENGFPFYTMKRVEGESLNWIISRFAAGSKEYMVKYNRHRLLDIFRKVCDAVSYAHSRGIIHRDIKPENVMVGQFGEVLLMDWGLAKVMEQDTTADSDRRIDPRWRETLAKATETQDGIIKGSLAYLSPEQAFGDLSEVDVQSDIFLLGATLYHMLTWSPPYYGGEIDDLLAKAERCDFEPPSTRNPGAQIPLALERVILRAMAPLKSNRYATVQEMIDELDAFTAGKRVGGRQIFAPGDKLIEAGDITRDTYVIISGKVQVSRIVGKEEQPIVTLGRGDILGEMAGITHQVRSATATAVETTDVLVISHDLMLEELEKLPPWMEKIIFSLADRIRALDANIHPLMLQNRSYPVVTQVYYLLSATEGAYGNGANLAKTKVIDEVVRNLGIDRDSVIKIINILLENRMLAETDGRLRITNLDDFGIFVDYCRYQFGVHGGIKEIDQIQISPEMNSYFRRTFRSLKALKVQDELDPVQPSIDFTDSDKS